MKDRGEMKTGESLINRIELPGYPHMTNIPRLEAFDAWLLNNSISTISATNTFPCVTKGCVAGESPSVLNFQISAPVSAFKQ